MDSPIERTRGNDEAAVAWYTMGEGSAIVPNPAAGSGKPKEVLAMDNEIVLKDGRLYGPWRQPRNLHNEIPGSIHDDKTAQRLGFRGGTVAGNIHFEMLVPLLLKAFGQRWFERGTLSIDFKYATVDYEEVRGILEQPPEGAADAQIEVVMERPDGQVVGIGTASVGSPAEQTCLGTKDLSKYDEGEYQALQGISPGDKFPVTKATITRQVAEERMQVITEPLDWYVGDSPWGGPIATPTVMVGALTTAQTRFLGERRGMGVGLYGAIEIRNVNGPVFIDRPYTTGGEVVARGQSPKTEYFWYESYLDDADGKRIAEMLMQLRFMKGSADLVPTARRAERA